MQVVNSKINLVYVRREQYCPQIKMKNKVSVTGRICQTSISVKSNQGVCKLNEGLSLNVSTLMK